MVVALTASRETWRDLSRVRIGWLAVAVGLWLVAVLADGTRLAVLSWAGPHRMNPLLAVEVLLIGYFMAAVTPFQFGGLPLQLYLMNRRGIPPGRASAVLLARGIIFYLLLFAVAPLVAMQLGVSSRMIRLMGGYIAVIVVLGAVLVLAAAVFPRQIERLRTGRLAGRSQSRVSRWLDRLLVEFLQMADGLKGYFVRRNLRLLVLALLLTVVYGAAWFAISGALLRGLGVMADFGRAAGLNMVLTAVLLFMPTPGAGGIAEAGALLVYDAICPRHLLGVFVVVWRFFSFYLGAVCGGILAARQLAAMATQAPVGQTGQG